MSDSLKFKGVIGLTSVYSKIDLALLTGIILIDLIISLSISDKSFLFSSDIKTVLIPALTAAYNFSFNLL